MLIYYIAAAIATLLSLFVFSDSINIVYMSLCPIVCIALMAFLAYTFYSVKSSKDINLTTPPDFTDKESVGFGKCAYLGFMIFIPTELPFIFFFSGGVKTLSVLPVFLSFILGGILFGVKHGKSVKDRHKNEISELEDQKKKEESGKF